MTEPTNDDAALQQYRVAYERLIFQDDYLFKFSTVLLTAHGGLALLAQWTLAQSEISSHFALALTSLFGIFLAVVWCLWAQQNDYWHSVWEGVLISIEKDHLHTGVHVFSADHHAIAKEGGRSKPYLRGRWLAMLLPIGLAVAWAITLVIALWAQWCGRGA